MVIGDMAKPFSGRARTVRASALLGVPLALVAPGPAPAQAPRLTVIGAGAGVSCAGWVAAGRSDPELEQWAFSFASAVAAGAQLRRGDDPRAIRRRMPQTFSDDASGQCPVRAPSAARWIAK